MCQGMARYGRQAGGDLGLLQRSVVAGIAATRLVRAWKFEVIGERPREALLDWLDKPVMRQPVAGHSYALDEVDARRTAVKEWFGELVDCPHCLGVHLSIVCAVALRHRRLRPVIEGLAGAMVLSAITQWFPGFDMQESFPALRIRVMGDETAERREP